MSEAEPRGPRWMRLVGLAQNSVSHARKPHQQASQPGEVALALVEAYEQGGRGWFWRTDAEGYLTYLSPQLAAHIGCTVDDLLGTLFSSLVTGDADDFDTAQRERTVEFTLSARMRFSDIAVCAAGMRDNWWSLSGTPAKDANGRFAGFVGSAVDLTDAEKSESDAANMALYDPLTALPNRRLMHRTLEELLRKKGNRAADCSLLLLDLDRFKHVNDTLGHPVGDALLKQVAKRLDRVVDTLGQVGRLGGDEFMVIVPSLTDKEELARLCQSIIMRLSLPFVIDDATVQIGATIGVALAPFDGDNTDELTRNADLALYAAKAAGKGVHRFYQPAMHEVANARRALENDLRDVLCLEQMDIMFQPIVDAKSEVPVGFEALIRWNHPKLGAVEPSHFIPIAEEVGQITRIGEWVLRKACMQAALWPEHLFLSVNMSPVQFTSPGLVAMVMSALAESGLSPTRLEIEITEGVFLEDNDTINNIFHALAGMGVRLVLDDFGTGYASLGYLNRVPLNKIKIDRSFIKGASASGRESRAIVQAIIGLANSLDMQTVAEGAETLDELEYVRALGCTQIQGFVFGRPMTADHAAVLANNCQAKAADTPDVEVERGLRMALLRIVKIHCEGEILTATMRNISEIGALIEVDGDARISTPLNIEFSDDMIVPATIKWRKESKIGVEFDEKIDVDMVVKAGDPRMRRQKPKQ
ncbi:MAG: EAL domain-containing protein [Chakrabartia sp.]